MVEVVDVEDVVDVEEVDDAVVEVVEFIVEEVLASVEDVACETLDESVDKEGEILELVETLG